MQFNRLRHSKLNRVDILTNEDVNEIVIILKQKECDVFPLIKVEHRIGSESLYATVWAVELLGKKIALKVQNNKEKSINEMEIHQFLNNWPDNFIQFYGELYCEHIDLLGVKENKVFSGYFMFQQLAVGDLAQYLLEIKENKKEEVNLLNFLLEIMDSVYILGQNQIYHGDLHIRNIFIVKIPNGNYRAVIGDFGESKGIDSITAHTSDIFKLTTSLLEFLNTYAKFTGWIGLKNKLKSIIKYISRRSVVVEADYEKWNLENRDEDGNVNLEMLDHYFDEIVAKTVREVKSILRKN